MPLTNKAIQDHGSELVFHELVTFPNFTHPQKKMAQGQLEMA